MKAHNYIYLPFIFEFVLKSGALDLDRALLFVEDEFSVWFTELGFVIVGIRWLEVSLPVLEGAEVTYDISVCA